MVECRLGRLLSNSRPVVITDDPAFAAELSQLLPEMLAELRFSQGSGWCCRSGESCVSKGGVVDVCTSLQGHGATQCGTCTSGHTHMLSSSSRHVCVCARQSHSCVPSTAAAVHWCERVAELCSNKLSIDRNIPLSKGSHTHHLRCCCKALTQCLDIPHITCMWVWFPGGGEAGALVFWRPP